jgi:hypothetical protein
MLKNMILSSLLLSLPVVAQAGSLIAKKELPPPQPVVKEKNWEIDTSLGIGYRQDQMKNTLYSPKGTAEQTYKEKDKDFQSVMEVLKIDARFYDFLINIEGDYSPLVSGRVKNDFIAPAGITETFFYKFKKVIGYEADAMGSIGYQFNFFKNKTTHLRFIPQVGYRYSTQVFEPQGESSFTVQPNHDAVTILSYLEATHKEWFGPYLEAIVSLSFQDRWFIEPFYQYHFLRFRERDILTDKFIPFQNASTSDITWRAFMDGNAAHGQAGGLNLYYQTKCHLKWGVKASALSFKTGRFKSHAHRTFRIYSGFPVLEKKNVLVQKSKGSWKNFSVYTYLGYEF